MTRSLQSRLLLGTAIAASIVLCTAAGVLYFLMRSSLYREFDASLAAEVRAMTVLLEQDGNVIKFEIENLNMPEYSGSGRPAYLQAWRADGHILARSPSLAGRDLAKISGSLNEPVYHAVTLPDGRRGRQVGISCLPRIEDNEGENRPKQATSPPVTLVLARETATIDRTLATLRLLLTGVWAVALVAMLAVLAIVVRRGLHPAEVLAARISELGEADLSARIELADVPAELKPVIDRLNQLLARLEEAFHRERAFSADVSHELRTPLAGLRSILEVSLSQPRDGEKYRQSIAESLDITEHIQSMVQNLLWLARAEAGRVQVTRESVDLGELLNECWQSMEDRVRERSLQVEQHIQSPCPVQADRDKLQQVIHNILENAVTYTNTGGRIRIEAGEQTGRISLKVTNSGSRVSPQDAPRVFDRFWRGDAARTDTGHHCGLGLSLCRKIVTLLGGTITAETTDGEFTITTVFPPQ